MIELGSKVKDTITGFAGTATARVEYINGCIQYCIQPRMTEAGKMPSAKYIDEDQLKITSKGASAKNSGS